jgi:hypothetical protein
MSYRQLVTTIIIVLTVFLFAACSRSKSAEPTTEDQPTADAAATLEDPAPGRVGQDRLNTDAAVPMRLTDQGRARAVSTTLAPADPRDTAFEGQRFSAVPFHARDTVLGPLGRIAGGSARDRAVLAVCEDLFSALLGGELPVDSLSSRLGPGGRAVLDDLIWAAETLSDARLGVAVALTDLESSVPFRLMGETRFAVGEVILEKLGDQWYTADIQVEFIDRDTISRFDPGAVRSDGTL